MLSFVQVAVPDVVDAAADADILIFVVPHQFIPRLCQSLVGKVKPTAMGLSLIKVRNFNALAWRCSGVERNFINI